MSINIAITKNVIVCHHLTFFIIPNLQSCCKFFVFLLQIHIRIKFNFDTLFDTKSTKTATQTKNQTFFDIFSKATQNIILIPLKPLKIKGFGDTKTQI